MSDPLSRQRVSPRWSNSLVVLAVLGVGIPLLVAAAAGDLAIPHSDAWAYSRIAEGFARTGTIRLLNWNDMTVIGQVVMLGPLGRSIIAQQVSVALLGLAALYCVYYLAGITLSNRRSLIAVLLMISLPGFASLTTSFMTDVPALAGSLGALTIGRLAIERDSRRLFVLAVLIAFWAVSIREQALAAPAALLIYTGFAIRRGGRLNLRFVIGSALVFVLAFALLMRWREAMPNGQFPTLTLNLKAFLDNDKGLMPQSWDTVAVALASATLLTVHPQNWRLGSWLAAGIALLGVLHLALSHYGWDGFTLGNYLSRTGEYGPSLPGSRAVIPNPIWDLAMILALVCAPMMAGTVVERWRQIDPLLALFTALAAATVVVDGGVQGQMFDRYVIPVIPGVLVILLTPPASADGLLGRAARRIGTLARPRIQPKIGLHRWRPAVAGGAAILVAALSVGLAMNAWSYDRARWEDATALVKQGVPATRIDAGMEWLGWHSADGASTIIRGFGALIGWAPGQFATQKPCVELYTSALPASMLRSAGWRLAKVYAYPTFLLVGTARLYDYETGARGCPVNA